MSLKENGRAELARPHPTAERVRELFDYDQATGVLTWKARMSPTAGPGDHVGHADHRGQIRTQFDGYRYIVARIIWLWMTGEWSSLEIDHRDTDMSNNRWRNLREATRSQNQQNKNASGSSGWKWVSRDPYSKKRPWKWHVECRVNGARKIVQGNTDCPAASHLTAVVAASKLHGEFMRHV